MKNTMTGNRALLKLRGQTIGGGVQNIDFSDDYGLQDVDGIGSPETQELVVGKMTHTINLSRFFIYNKKLIDLGLVPNSDEVLTSGDLEIEVIDNVSGTTLELYTGCKVASGTRNYSKHAITSEAATFRALHKAK